VTFKDYDPKYESLVRVLKRAYDRAATGKGHAHHSQGEAFEEQWIARGARLFGLGGILFQLGKKNEQIVNMKKNVEKINEFLDIINYAAAGVIILDEDENQELEKEDFAVEELIISRLHSKSISKSQCEVLFEMFPNLKILEKYRIELFQHVKE